MMNVSDPLATARLFDEARQARRLANLSPEVMPHTIEDGASVQVAMAQLRGDTVAGFKIGATTKAMQTYLGLPGPAAGYIAATGVHPSGARLSYADFYNPGIECELAVRLGRDLPAGPCTRAEAEEAVGEVMAAIEIVENRYGDLAEFGTPALIADQVFHAGAVLGEAPARDWRLLDIANLRGRVAVDGEVRGEGLATDLMGHPINCLMWLAGSAVAAAFGGLLSGQTIMLGSVTPPIWLERPAQVVVAFDDLPVVTLDLTA